MNGFEHLFTDQAPLGPIAISDHTQIPTLEAIYDSRVDLHLQSAHNPPTFIVGRRGSGKTALLLSREFDDSNVAIRLSTADLFSHVQSALDLLEKSSVVSVEIAAKLWDALLWAPIAVRLTEAASSDSEAFRRLWKQTRRLREAPALLGTRDDAVLGLAGAELSRLMEENPQLKTVDAIIAQLRLSEYSWAETIRAAQDLLTETRLPLFVLIDSLEDAGSIMERIEMAVRGLLHLVGKTRLAQTFSYYKIQCCFPSELWPLLDQMSANPVKDFAGRLVLQWRWHDLVKACDKRFLNYLELHHPSEYAKQRAQTRVVEHYLPRFVASRTGIQEEVIPYILRHTQLLPRQVIYILNECFARAIARRNSLHVQPAEVVEAVGEVEATLCPEVFSAHGFRYPEASVAAIRLIPLLPFKFDDGELHEAYNQAGLKKLQLDYRYVRQMLTDIGVIGRLIDETERYLKAEFAYSIEGQLVLSPDEDYCLHPLFVRQYNSRDIAGGKMSAKPVYPVGTPERAFTDGRV